MLWNMLIKIAMAGTFCTFLFACQSADDTTLFEQAIASNAQNMQVTYQVVSNTSDIDCRSDIASGECYQSTLELTFSAPLPKDGWHIYFSHLSPIQDVQSDYFHIKHVNGDLHKLSAKANIDTDQMYKIDLVSAFWSVSKTDVLPNYYFAYGNNQTAVIQATQEILNSDFDLPTLPHAGSFALAHQIKRNSDDRSQRHSAEFLYYHNQSIRQVDKPEQYNYAVVPKILDQTVTHEKVDISTGLYLSPDIVEQYPAVVDILQTADVVLSDNGLPVTAELASKMSRSEYSLLIDSARIRITAKEPSSIFYGLISLAQMANRSHELSTGLFVDSPRYTFRGVHLDVARNFRSVEFVEMLIKEMAWLKLNKLHLHLADDEGWRLAIDGLPELTNVGAFRCHDPDERTCLQPQLGSGPDRDANINGFYSVEDYKRILQIAALHHIEVIPSLDMPGHSRAAIKAMEARYLTYLEKGKNQQAEEYLLTDFNDETHYSSVQHYKDNTLNPCLPSTFNFVEKVLMELIEQHNRAGVPLKRYHIGADETAGAWHQSPACKQLIQTSTQLNHTEELGGYFIERVAKMVQQQGIMAAGWSDGMREFSPQTTEKMQVNVWDALMWQGHTQAQKFAEKGWHTVLSYPDVTYFDFPYAVDPNEPGYYWASRATDSYKVFQFIPDDAGQNARLWHDRLNKPYNAEQTSLNQPQYEGIQAHLWSEIVRHDDVAAYMYFPRLISFAQQAWHKPSWQTQAAELTDQALNTEINRQWRAFSEAIVTRHMTRLSALDIPFRVPPPGAIHLAGKLHMNHLYDGMQLEYQIASGEWQPYIQPIDIDLNVMVRARVPHTQRVSAEVKIHESSRKQK